MRKIYFFKFFKFMVLFLLCINFGYSQLVAPQNPRWIKVFKTSVTVGWDWTGNFATTTYRVEISTSSNFGIINASSQTVRNSTVTVTGLYMNELYYGRVVAYDGSNSTFSLVSNGVPIRTVSDYVPKIEYINFIDSYKKEGIYYDLPLSPTSIEIDFNKYISTKTISTAGNIYIILKKNQRREVKNTVIIPNINIPDPNIVENGKYWDYFAAGVSKIEVFTNLSPSCEYELVITTGLKDVVSTPLDKEYRYTFFTKLNSTSTSNLIKPDGSEIELLIPINALDEGMFVTPKIIFSTGVAEFLSKTPQLYNFTNFLEVRCYKKDNRNVVDNAVSIPGIEKEMLLTFTYKDDDFNDIVDGTNIYAPTLTFWRLDDRRETFIRIPSFVEKENKTVTAKVKTFGVYAVAGTPKMVIDDVFCFPVPWVPESGKPATGNYDDGITFANLPYNCEISVYSISGELVFRKDIPNNISGEYKWKGKNDFGEDVGSGVYIWIVKTPYERKVGKLIIVR